MKSQSDNQPTIEDYATIEAYVGDVPVYAFGYTYVYGSSPDLMPEAILQEDNNNPAVKLKPKKSWEITSNRCGSTPAREPKTMWNDDQPLLPVHLIDGDPETAWSSRGMNGPAIQPEWIRIDFPAESTVGAVSLVCCKNGPHRDPNQRVGKSLPKHLTIKLSRDGKLWDTVYENRDFSGDDCGATVIRFQPHRAKTVWVIGEQFGRVGNWGPGFSIGQLEVHDPHGANLALISRGAGVQVSSTYYDYGMDRFTQDMLWPIQYDLGFKWTRVGYDIGLYLWSYVEREKGKLQIDPKADTAITEAHDNGVNVILCLDKGNWLYRQPPRKTDWKKERIYEMMTTYYDHQGWPNESEEMMAGYLRYVDYMVRHFKGRVTYFEICNEWPHTISVEDYVKIVNATIEVIKNADTDARIMLGSVNPYRGELATNKSISMGMAAQIHGGINQETILGCLRSGEPNIASQIDAVGWHPWYQADPETPQYRGYRGDFNEFKKKCDALGFKGDYIASEWTWMAPYPMPEHSDWPLDRWTSEMQKAKYCAQRMTADSGMGIISLYNETFQTGRIERDCTLLRNSSFQVDPITPAQPQAAYYVLRNISTILDGFKPAEFPVQFSGDEEFECYTFRRDNQEQMFAVWIPGRSQDGIAEVKSDIIVSETHAKCASGIDGFNGTRQELNVTHNGNDTVLKNMLIKDYPVFVVLNNE